jgi:predicted nucleic acid-binding protein
MPHLIDSDWMIDYVANDPTARGLVAQLVGQRIAISIITYIELAEGVLRSPNAASESELADLGAAIPILPVTLATEEICAGIRNSLRQQGSRVRPRALDLLIASTAIEHGLTLVTRNLGDYSDIPGLSIHRPDQS